MKVVALCPELTPTIVARSKGPLMPPIRLYTVRLRTAPTRVHALTRSCWAP